MINSEDPIQAYITIVTAGSLRRVALAKLAVAWLACVPLALMGGQAPFPRISAQTVVEHG